jgi:hypothetical protein
MDDDYDDYDDDSSSFLSDEYGDIGGRSYEPRSVGYSRNPLSLDDDDIDPLNRSSMGRGNYSSLNSNRRNTNATGPIRPPPVRGTRTLAGDDDFDDAASVNSTYAN